MDLSPHKLINAERLLILKKVIIMFDVWSLGIPVPERYCAGLQKLILKIADKEYGLDKDLLKKISVKPEFHITLGVFHSGMFETNRGLFRHLLYFISTKRDKFNELKEMFKGDIEITGIGYDKSSINKSQVVWASATSSQIDSIREKIHNLLKFSGIDESHFKFTDPHITLFMEVGKGDLHEIRKLKKLPLNNYIAKNMINFNFDTVCIYSGPKIKFTFGDRAVIGKPSEKFKTLLQAELVARKPKVQFNVGALFKAYSRDEALKIKNILLNEGPKGLAANGYKVADIMKIVRK
jgi:hypothetical protein